MNSNNTVRNRHGSAVITLPSDTECLITRAFDAPAKLVFKAMTTPEYVQRWWAGDGAEWSVCEVDLRVGGQWRWVFREGDEEVGFHGEYREITAPDRLVYTEMYEGVPDPSPGDYALVTTTFDEVDGVTTMSLLTTMPSQETRDMLLASGMEEGMQASYDRLEDIVRSAA